MIKNDGDSGKSLGFKLPSIFSSSSSSEKSSTSTTSSKTSMSTVEKCRRFEKQLGPLDFPQFEDCVENVGEFLLNSPVVGIIVRYLIRDCMKIYSDLQAIIKRNYPAKEAKQLLLDLEACRFSILRSDFVGTRTELENKIKKANQGLEAIYQQIKTQGMQPQNLRDELDRITAGNDPVALSPPPSPPSMYSRISSTFSGKQYLPPISTSTRSLDKRVSSLPAE